MIHKWIWKLRLDKFFLMFRLKGVSFFFSSLQVFYWQNLGIVIFGVWYFVLWVFRNDIEGLVQLDTFFFFVRIFFKMSCTGLLQKLFRVRIFEDRLFFCSLVFKVNYILVRVDIVFLVLARLFRSSVLC